MSSQEPPDRRWQMRDGVPGLAAGIVVVAAWWLGYQLGVTTFPPFDFGDYIIRRSPGGFATWAIESLGTWAQDLALLTGLLAWLLVWVPLGVLVGRFRDWSHAWLIPVGLLPFAVALGWWARDWTGLSAAIVPASLFAASLVAGGWLLQRWLVRLAELASENDAAAHHWLDQPGNYERRALLRQIAVVTLAAGIGGPNAARVLREIGADGPETAQAVPLDDARDSFGSAFPTAVPVTQYPEVFSAPPGVRQKVTSNEEFYVVDISTRDPALYEGSWSLRIHGLVDRELVLTWPELLALPSVELDGTLMCISYEHDNDLISSTRWTGVPLRDVLSMVGVRDGVVDLICRGENGYSDSIPLAKALEPTTLLAYGMNGSTLPRAHGFPCRLYVPGLYGEKHVKWLQEIELSDQDYQGFWQERGWTDVAIVNTVSIIDTPRGTVLGDAGSVPIGGIAFAGDRGISRVQVRIDDGNWLDADLEPNEPPLVWQRWSYQWRPALGTYRVTVRAFDGSGTPQEERERPPHPDGMTGLHSVTVDIV